MCSLSEFFWGVRLFYLIYPPYCMDVSLPWLYPLTPFSTHRLYLLEDSLIFNPGFKRGIFADSILYINPSPISDGYKSFLFYGEGSPGMKGGGIERPIFLGKMRAWGYLGMFYEEETNYHGELIHPLPLGSLSLTYHRTLMLSFKSQGVFIFLSPHNWRIWVGGRNYAVGILDGSPGLSLYLPFYYNLFHLFGTYTSNSSCISLSYFITENSTLTISYPYGVALRTKNIDISWGRWFWIGIRGKRYRLYLKKDENLEVWGGVYSEWSIKGGKIKPYIDISFFYGDENMLLISPGLSILGVRVYLSIIPQPFSFSYWLYLSFTD